jgi:chlorobactene glucosyltransferase
VDPLPGAILSILAAGSLFSAVYHAVLWFRTARFGRDVPTLRDGLARPRPEGEPPRVCVVVPAHDEARVIARLARSLTAQDYPSLRMVFALDRCGDDTRAVLEDALAGDARAEIVEIDACPDDWAGKVHAAHAGVTRSEGARGAELLLFTDADTFYEPGAVRAAVALLHERGLGLLSLLSTLTHERWYEWLVQPATGLELVRRFPIDRLNRADGNIRFANGQFMLFRRELYDHIGGHAAVRGELLEDLAFARATRRSDRWSRVGVLLADGVMRCEMYHDWREFRRGWKRIFTESARRRVRMLRRDALRQAAAGALLPGVSLACLPAAAAAGGWWGVGVGLAGLAGLVAYAGGLLAVAAQQRAPRWILLTFPLGAILSASILAGAAADLARGRATTWGGRAYHREPDPS